MFDAATNVVVVVARRDASIIRAMKVWCEKQDVRREVAKGTRHIVIMISWDVPLIYAGYIYSLKMTCVSFEWDMYS